jgi:murein DD-endopeptidase MepM/ murein hydrolase activator NlpD
MSILHYVRCFYYFLYFFTFHVFYSTNWTNYIMEVFSLGEKNVFKKPSKLFDKEGFYIVLFVCLCIVAVTAVYMSKNNADNSHKAVAERGKVQTMPKSTDPLLTLQGEGSKSVLTSQQPVKSKKDVALENEKSRQIAKANAKTTVTTATKAKLNSKREVKTKNLADTFKILLPVKGDVVKKFDNKELQFSKAIGQWETHEGIDIACELGSEIKAANGGKVVDIVVKDEKLLQNAKNGYGASVIIEHESGYKTVYSNLDSDSIKVKKGASISAGEVIGTVGDTSQREAISLEGSHLHFELLKKDGNQYVSVNPEKFLK